MNINDIPLPPTPKNKLYDVSKVLENKDNHASSRIFPVKRHVNKLPVGVLKKNDDSKIGELSLHRKELFLPTMNDKIQLAMSNFNPTQSKKLEMLLNATKLKPVELNVNDNNKNRNDINTIKKSVVDEKSESRKRRQKNDLRQSKKPKFDIISNHENEKHDKRKNEIQDNPVVMKSQVVVKRSNITNSVNHSNDHRNKYYMRLNPSPPHYHGRNRSNVRDYHRYCSNHTNNDYKHTKSSFVEPISNYSRGDQKHEQQSHRMVVNHHPVHRNDSRHRERTTRQVAINHRWKEQESIVAAPLRPKQRKAEAGKSRRKGEQSIRDQSVPSPSTLSRSSSSSSGSSSSSAGSSSSSAESSSLSSSGSSGSSPSMGNSRNSNEPMELPMVSPNSPDEDNRLMDSINDGLVPNALPCTSLANDCLKELSATLVRMNQAYKSVYSKIPNIRLEEEKLSNIPLPINSPILNAQYAHSISTDNGIDKPALQLTNGNHDATLEGNAKEEPLGVPQKQRVSSDNIDNLSHISRSSCASKNGKSPFYSHNVSNTSKDSEFSDLKARPLVPKICNYSIDYSNIDAVTMNEIFSSKNFPQYFINDMRCCCSIPNPDAWSQGVRSCGSGQNCILAQLHIECNNQLCPTESLCCNTQFCDLDSKSNKSHNIEFFFDVNHSIPWKIRAKKFIQKRKLIFEVAGIGEMSPGKGHSGGEANPSISIFVSKHIKLDVSRDMYSYMHYLRYTRSAEQSNVSIEKWLIAGGGGGGGGGGGWMRLGIFAAKDLHPGQELLLYVPQADNAVDAFYSMPCCSPLAAGGGGGGDESLALDCVLYLLHEPITSADLLIAVLDALLLASSGTHLDRFASLGGIVVLCSLCDSWLHRCTTDADAPGAAAALVLDKLAALLLLPNVPYSEQPFGLHLPLCVSRICSQSVAMAMAMAMAMIPNDISCCCSIEASVEKLRNTYQQMEALPSPCPRQPNAGARSCPDVLHCRLPPYWVSRQCNDAPAGAAAAGAPRVFFYHRVSKWMQWEMPVYPWEGGSDAGADIYDYNGASQHQVTHGEIEQMYLNLNSIYQMKQQQKLQAANASAAKRQRDSQDSHKRDAFKRKMMAVIAQLLKPHRDARCTQGRIQTDDDLNYLTNKLSQTILYKELKILNDKTEHLEVTAQVEAKTKAYVKTYMQSRGIIYKRPVHCSIPDQRNGALPPALQG